MVILLWLLYNLRQIGTARQYFSRLLGTRLRQCYYNFTRDHGQQILAANHDVSFAYFLGLTQETPFYSRELWSIRSLMNIMAICLQQ